MSAESTPASPENPAGRPDDADPPGEPALQPPVEGAPAPLPDADGPAVLEVPHDLGAVLDSVVAERDELKVHLDEQRDAHARLAADFDNFKKRTARTQRDEVARVAGSIIESLLPVLDGCDAAVLQGVEGVQPLADLLFGSLHKEGLTRLDPLGDVFDPALHQAVVNEPAADDATGGLTVVIEVMRPGYLWRDQVLRPAMVKVQDQ